MDQKIVKKYTKGEVYHFVDSFDKTQVPKDQLILVGSRPVMVIKGNENNTSIVIPFTRNSTSKIISVNHTNGVESYAAHDSIKTVNNKDLVKYLSTVVNPDPIIDLVSSYVNGEDISRIKERELKTSVFSEGQVWKKKEGANFLVLKVLAECSTSGCAVLMGIPLDQSEDGSEEFYDLEIPHYNRKLHIDLFKMVVISSNEINYYQGRIDESQLNVLKNKFVGVFLDKEQVGAYADTNQVDIMFGRIKTPRVNSTITSCQDKVEEDSKPVEETQPRKRRVYTDEEKQFILDNNLDVIQAKFSIDYAKAYKLKYYVKTTFKPEETTKEETSAAIDEYHKSQVTINLNNKYNEEDVLFIRGASIVDIQSRYGLKFKDARSLKRRYN